MKLNNVIFPVLAGSLMLVGCYDEKMDWHTPDGHNPVTTDDIPLQLQEKIDSYDFIKNYAAQYMPGTPIGVGLSADKYLDEDDPDYAALCDNNFQQFVTGNAMKMDAMVTTSGALNTTKLDAFLAKAPADMEIFGHNFIWHTQQQQTYLLSLIAPEMIVETDGDIITMLQNGDFESGQTSPWTGWGGESTREVVAGEGVDGSYAMKCYNPAAGSEYSAQLVYNLTEPLENGKTYVLRFQIRAAAPGGSIQFAWQNLSYGNGEIYHTFDNIGTDWVTFEEEFTCTKDDAQQLLFNFGKVATTYYIDNVEFGTRKEEGASAQANRATRATTITYKLKTPEEKRTALLGAMESWIKGMLQHVSGDQRFVGWDVINEPITDDGYYRGIDKHFGATWEDDNGNTQYDAEPTETTTDGLNLNWGSGHFYWGYYLGMDYAVQAFKLARQYAPADMKLYVNDYNLETNPSKLAKLIEFVNYIDQNGGQTLVDGIATQMHVDMNNLTREQVDQMFQTMAATGKMVRVSELDVKVGTATPTADDLQKQSDVYQMIIESYKENVPEAQRGGFVIWGVSDAADEHEYWIPNDAPNLFDANYGRKVAYKGVCDGIAGTDLGADFTGDMWKDLVESEDDETTDDGGSTAEGE